MNRPPDERAPDNPWPQWPKVYKLDYGQEEAKALWGDDPRQYAVSTKRFLVDATGQVTGLEIVEVDWRSGRTGASACRRCRARSGRSRRTWCCWRWASWVPSSPLPEQFGCELDAAGQHPRGRRQADHRAGGVHGRRLHPRPVPGGVGHQRGPRGGAWRRPLPQGRVPRGPLAMGQPDRGGRLGRLMCHGRPAPAAPASGSTLAPLRA